MIKQEEIEKFNADEKLAKTKMMEQKIKKELEDQKKKESEENEDEN